MVLFTLQVDVLALGKWNITVAPSRGLNEREMKLAKVWSEILGVPLSEINPDSSFFAVGGDSISAIRVVSKAKQAGISVTSNQIFKTPTLSALASSASVTDSIKQISHSSEIVIGATPLAPISKIFFDHDWSNINHFNQAVSLKLRKAITLSQLKSAFSSLLKHHDILRSRFHGQEGNSAQYITADCRVYAKHIQCASMDEYQQAVRLAEESLSITSGKLHALVLASFSDGVQRLHITIHHLVVDVVSWTIILEDLMECLEGRPLPSKTTSYKQWTESLIAQTSNYNVVDWASYTEGTTLLQANEKRGQMGEIQKTVEGVSDSVLNYANRRYGTNSQELILAALSLALSDLISETCWQLDMESHGREPWSDDLDLSRTVGWFTSVYPVSLPCTKGQSVAEVIKSVRQRLRDAPNKGISYLALTNYKAGCDLERKTRIAFNYIPSVMADDENALLQFDSDVDFDFSLSSDNSLFNPVNIVCSSHKSGLQMHFTYEQGWIEADFVEQWMESFSGHFENVLAHCSEAYSQTVLSAPLLPSLKCFYEVEATLLERSLLAHSEDIYPTTALQHVFLLRLIQHETEYTNTLIIDLRGAIDIATFRQAWTQVVLTHQILRTVFVSTTAGIMQVVLNRDFTEWVDLKEWSALEIDHLTEKQCALEREKNFSFDSASFIRMSYAKINGEY
jgi:non-ribosomal peptide synthase protein (TIGR01720 family)